MLYQVHLTMSEIYNHYLPPILPEGDFPGEKPQETEDKGSGLSKKTYQLCYYVMILNTKVW
jgi:hypothetical protein